MDEHQPDLNQILGNSTEMLTNYHQLIADSSEMPDKPDVLINMANMLADVQNTLQKEMDDNSVTHVKTDKLKHMNEALNDFLSDSSTLKKIEAVQDAHQGSSTAFLNQLRTMQKLMITLEDIKSTRGRRGSDS